jgi:hypothetical protein
MEVTISPKPSGTRMLSLTVTIGINVGKGMPHVKHERRKSDSGVA